MTILKVGSAFTYEKRRAIFSLARVDFVQEVVEQYAKTYYFWRDYQPLLAALIHKYERRCKKLFW